MAKPNEFEHAILIEIAKEYPELSKWIGELRVSKREFSGAGSYTYFEPISVAIKVKGDLNILNLPKVINVSGIEYGLGAHLEMNHGIPEFLEIYTFGTVSWNGVYEGFSID